VYLPLVSKELHDYLKSWWNK